MQKGKQKQKRPTRRSMTFSGCFTCRARGVKCDEQRPACQRCVKAKRMCAGYGVRLIWEDRDKRAESGLRSERRPLPWAYGYETGDHTEVPALRDADLDAVIAALPEDRGHYPLDPYAHAQAHPHPHARLFTVLMVTPPVPSPLPLASLDDVLAVHDLDFHNLGHLNELGELDDIYNMHDTHHFGNLHGHVPNDLHSIYNLSLEQWWVTTPTSTSQDDQRLIPNDNTATLELCLSPRPTKESRLLDYWIAHTSSIMVSIPRRDNPFRSIFVPMALVAQSQLFPSDEHTALLHGIYAMAAFNCAQQQSITNSGAYNSLGMSHHQVSLAHLQRSLSSLSLGFDHTSNPEAILATIILLITTNCITGNSTAWRSHIRLGRQWLLSSVKAPWRTQHAACTLYHIFLILEAIGTSANMSDLLDTADGSDGASHGHDYTYNSIFGLSCTALYHDYQLDSLYGITQPIFEAIVHIDRLGARSVSPSQQELENLRVKILLNDPRALRISALDNADDTEHRFVRHHAYVFYFACRIHYERVLFRATPHAIQNLVRCALDHLEAIASLETNTNVAGLTWPVFVVACEADDPVLQKRFGWYFDKGQKYGIWSISSAYLVLSEVWRRRRNQSREDQANESWQQVMTDLGLDLLLT
ncbi:putative argr fungal zinc cluster transcription factor [Grosmannia clavigera kw1407]|uniref:Putative argr fungal zinc cluster transcription factor n=1 Tax=Grosmannia clavigera (strain kw1407 / UAMH 11150) TaxID=655863 RepID=F0XB52_GROCL|nr:putative argr fungal zinc cluster transcription factor [Grosmannia clavigera kw1407]EFX04986.1 putative argr fungal zinc cluster transcription factor [Grosmannia clavigera kw1407]